MARIGLKGLTCATFASGGNGQAVTYASNSGVTSANLMISADVTLNRDDAKLSADDHVVERVNGVTGGTIALELASLPDNIITKLLGYAVASKVLTVTGNEAPYVGFGYITCDVTGGTKTYKAYWFPKVQFGLENDNAKTKGESTEFQTNTLSGEILGVVTSSGGNTEFYYVESESTETAARTWLNSKAGIT